MISCETQRVRRRPGPQAGGARRTRRRPGNGQPMVGGDAGRRGACRVHRHGLIGLRRWCRRRPAARPRGGRRLRSRLERAAARLGARHRGGGDLRLGRLGGNP